MIKYGKAWKATTIDGFGKFKSSGIPSFKTSQESHGIPKKLVGHRRSGEPRHGLTENLNQYLQTNVEDT